MRADGLDDLVWEHVIALLANPALVRAELDRRLERMRDADPVRAHQERLHRQIATVDAAISRLISAYQEDLITRDELRARIPALRAQRQNLHGQLEALAAQLVDQQAYLRLAENLEGFLARLRESARTTSVLERQRVLRAVVKEVRIGADKITIRHSIPSTSSDPTPGYLLRCGRARQRDMPCAGGWRSPRKSEHHHERDHHGLHPARHESPRTDPSSPQGRQLLPKRFYLDPGYPSAELITGQDLRRCPSNPGLAEPLPSSRSPRRLHRRRFHHQLEQ
ncbi:hypothetical protein [Streptomyces sp. NPDC002758]